MEFSAAAAFLPKDAHDAQAAEMVTSAEATADEPGEPPAAPTVEEVQALRREVGAQQGQPNLTQTPAASQQVLAVGPRAGPQATPTLGAGGVASTGSRASGRWGEGSASGFTDKSVAVGNKPVAQWTAGGQALLPMPLLD